MKPFEHQPAAKTTKPRRFWQLSWGILAFIVAALFFLSGESAKAALEFLIPRG
jgi:hypothetical protein